LKTDPLRSIESVTSIDTQLLNALNIKLLVLDFDGVLASHGESKMRPDIELWLQNLAKDYGGENIAFFTNNLFDDRKSYFNNFFPEFTIIENVAKKPYPDGLESIAKKKGILKQQVVLVDDRLLTGMLATCIMGCQGIYISKPLANFKNRFVKEAFFASLRIIERFII